MGGVTGEQHQEYNMNYTRRHTTFDLALDYDNINDDIQRHYEDDVKNRRGRNDITTIRRLATASQRRPTDGDPLKCDVNEC